MWKVLLDTPKSDTLHLVHRVELSKIPLDPNHPRSTFKIVPKPPKKQLVETTSLVPVTPALLTHLTSTNQKVYLRWKFQNPEFNVEILDSQHKVQITAPADSLEFVTQSFRQFTNDIQKFEQRLVEMDSLVMPSVIGHQGCMLRLVEILTNTFISGYQRPKGFILYIGGIRENVDRATELLKSIERTLLGQSCSKVVTFSTQDLPFLFGYNLSVLNRIGLLNRAICMPLQGNKIRILATQQKDLAVVEEKIFEYLAFPRQEITLDGAGIPLVVGYKGENARNLTMKHGVGMQTFYADHTLRLCGPPDSVTAFIEEIETNLNISVESPLEVPFYLHQYLIQSPEISHINCRFPTVRLVFPLKNQHISSIDMCGSPLSIYGMKKAILRHLEYLKKNLAVEHISASPAEVQRTKENLGTVIINTGITVFPTESGLLVVGPSKEVAMAVPAIKEALSKDASEGISDVI